MARVLGRLHSGGGTVADGRCSHGNAARHTHRYADSGCDRHSDTHGHAGPDSGADTGTAQGNTRPPKPTPTPLPALAIGLCTGAQLSLSITSWQNDGTTSYPHITATNVSSGSCTMRGTPQTQILDGHGSVIGDAGSGGGEVKTSDPVYTLAPNGTINDIVTWGNWCKAAPAQDVRVAVVMPFGLGKMVASPLGSAPIPTCLASNQSTSVSAEQWTP